MKIKLTGSIFIALIIYLITVLIGLIQFNPLSGVLFSGLKWSITGFAFTLILTYSMELMKTKQKVEEDKGNPNEQVSNQPQGKASKEYSRNNQAQDLNASTSQQQNDQENTSEKNEEINEENFNEMEPPVIEYEEAN